MLGATRQQPQLMNLESSKSQQLELGTTEYVLISMWFAFTAGVFGLLYKITSEADQECENNLKRSRVEGLSLDTIV